MRQRIGSKILVFSVFAALIFEALTGILVAKRGFPSFISLGVMRLLEILVFLLIITGFNKDLSSIGLFRTTWASGLKKGLIWSAGFGVCAAAGFAILYMFQIHPLSLLGRGISFKRSDLIAYFIVGGLISPVAEEIFFRGIIYGFLRRWGVFLALICTTALFAVIHSSGMHIPVIQALGGLLFAVAYEVEGSLMVPITIHVLGNMAIFTVLCMV